AGLLINFLIVGVRGPEALGVYSQVFAVFVILSQVAVVGLHQSSLKHVSHESNDLNAVADILAAAMLLLVPVAGILSLLAALFGPSTGRLVGSVEVGAGIVYAMPGMFFFVLNKVLLSTVNGLRHMRYYAVFRSLRFIFMPLVIIAVLVLDRSNAELALSLTISEVLLFFVLVVYLNGRVLPRPNWKQLRARMGQHIDYAKRGALSGVLIDVNARVDVLMLGLFLSDTFVGIYSFAAVIAEGFAQIGIAISYNVDPIVGRHLAQSRKEAVTKLARDIRRWLLPLSVALGGVAILVFPVLYRLMVGTTGLWAALGAFAVLMTGYVVAAGYVPMRNILIVGGGPGLFTGVMLVTFISNVVLNVALIPFIGLLGAAVATALSFVWKTYLITRFADRHLGIVI
ncbi:MAG: oligosaccharide flippase family protein, partial [Chloroflexota bacterium]